MTSGYERIGWLFLNKLGPEAERRGTGRNNDVPHVISKWILPALVIALPVAFMRPLTSKRSGVGLHQEIRIILEHKKHDHLPKSKSTRDLAVTRIR